jgi:lipopolysaccharide transport system ATP-binding protein
MAPRPSDEPSSAAPLAVEIHGVTKSFRRRTVRGGMTSFKTQLVNLFVRNKREQFELQKVDVLKGIDLHVPAGKTLGIIGQNGSGKSTLLKILTGIYAPTTGTAVVRGRVSALLELGAGFHPDFSGRENIFVNGVILGLTRAQIREKVDEIIAFSELESFIDEPVRNYSSGMYMRLAFAVSTFVDPDVLVIDEILSVGDEHFTRKSRAKMEEFKERGKTIVLVTHDLGTVERWCDMAAWIDQGRIAEVGDPLRVVAAYRQKVAEREMERERAKVVQETAPAPAVTAVDATPEAPVEGHGPARWGNRKVQFTSVRVLDKHGRPADVLDPEDAVTFELSFTAQPETRDVGFGIGIFRADGLQVYGSNTFLEKVELPKPLPASGTLRVVLDRLGLVEGNYRLDVACHAEHGLAYDYQRAMHSFAVRSEVRDVGMMRPPHRWELGPAQNSPVVALPRRAQQG